MPDAILPPAEMAMSPEEKEGRGFGTGYAIVGAGFQLAFSILFFMWMGSLADRAAHTKPLFLLVGLGIGALLGILFAPGSGEDTRDLIAGKVRGGLHQAVNKGAELRRRAQEALHREKEQISEAIEAGKQAYYEEQSRRL